MNKKWLWMALAALVSVALIWQFWVRNYLDEKKFERIETEVNELTKRIENKFGITLVETRKYCRHEERKFETGPLNCAISNVFDAGDIAEEDIVNFSLSQTDLVANTAGRLNFELIDNTRASCNIVKSIASNLFPAFSDSQLSQEKMYINLDCSRRATKSHYKLVE